jgi:NAD+ kinase
MKVVLSPNPYRDRGLKAAQAADKILKNVGVKTVMCLPFSLEGNGTDFPKHIRFGEIEEELKSADMLICFGGDGTILHAAKSANACHVPILGVNLGSVGFMAELEQSELPLLSRLACGKYTLEARVMLDVAVRREGKIVYTDLALNDAVVAKGAIARVVDLEVYGDNVLITSFSSDGVVISTPTGSTAYSMSAGGPIVEPTAENMIVTPICPHALSARSFVLGSERLVSVKMGKMTRKTAYLSVDGGKAFKLIGGDVVELRVSEDKTNLVHLTGRTFYEILSQKLGGHNP